MGVDTRELVFVVIICSSFRTLPQQYHEIAVRVDSNGVLRRIVSLRRREDGREMGRKGDETVGEQLAVSLLTSSFTLRHTERCFYRLSTKASAPLISVSDGLRSLRGDQALSTDPGLLFMSLYFVSALRVSVSPDCLIQIRGQDERWNVRQSAVARCFSSSLLLRARRQVIT